MPIYRNVGAGVLLGMAQKALDAAVKTEAEQLERDAEDNAPVLTGALQASIESVVNASTARISTGGAADEYVGYVEKGTSDTAAVPFMEQAVMAATKSLPAEVAKRSREVF